MAVQLTSKYSQESFHEQSHEQSLTYTQKDINTLFDSKTSNLPFRDTGARSRAADPGTSPECGLNTHKAVGMPLECYHIVEAEG